MTKRLKRKLLLQACPIALSLGLLLLPAANAALIPTDEAVLQMRAQQERGQLQTMLGREDVRKQLEAQGISPDQTRDRINGMTDEEVRQLAGKINQLPAGGALSNYELVLIILIALVIALAI